MFVTNLLISVVSLVTLVNGLICPACPDLCKDADFMDCNSCSCAPTCDQITCEGARDCVLKTAPCHREPCPKLPQCIDFTKFCLSPLRNHDSVILCNDDMVQCPRDYSCVNVTGHSLSVCCRDESDSELFPPGFDNVSPDSVRPPMDTMLADFLPDCDKCERDPCEYLSCVDHPSAQCVVDDCTCRSWFIDPDMNTVNCSEGKGAVIPPLLQPPRIDVEFPAPTTESPKQGGSRQNNHSAGMGDVIIPVVVASCIFLIAIIVFIFSCKVIRHQKKNMQHSHEEQLAPLQDVEKTMLA